jgi:hypothetical protein
MLTLIHGDDSIASRNYYIQLKQKSVDPIVLEGESITLTDLMQIFEGGGLFNASKNVFIEQIISKKKKTSDYEKIFSYIQKISEDNTIIIWENKEIEKSAVNRLKTATIKIFKLPQTLFLFLDNLKPGNGKMLVSLFHKTMETTETEMVFFMLIRQFRFLLALSEKSDAEIDEVKRLAPWQKTKLEKQTTAFGKEKLLELYTNLFTLEVGQKTGTLSLPLPSAIDFFLFEI